jgi:N-acetylglucosamine kinase-like BadF-type ATPase
MAIQLIADSGSTKTDWCLLNGKKKTRISTQGISPYFLQKEEVVKILTKELLPKLAKARPSKIFYYGTGCSQPAHIKMIKQSLQQVFPGAQVSVEHDLAGAAKALCGRSKGIACILGTGYNSCYYNGKKIVKNSPGLGYVLGDEGSGAYLGKKVLQYFLYQTFDPELMDRFRSTYQLTSADILDAVYKQPLPNRYLARFAGFLADNRGHYMIENIIEDGLNDFFFQHLYKYRESWTLPIHFVGSIAFGFKDVLKELCSTYELELGKVLKTPMDGLIQYHQAS